MLTVRVSNNKTEELMNHITGSLLRSKRKYFVVCENNRKIQYVDGSKDREFLLRVKKNLDRLLEETEPT